MRTLLSTLVAAPLLLPVSRVRAGPATEHWAAHTDMGSGAAPYHIVVGNPDPSVPAGVTVETEAGVVASASVPAEGVHVFVLDSSRIVWKSVLGRLAYRVRSDRPVHAYQFRNYYNNTSDDGGWLATSPEQWGTEYVVLSLPAGTNPAWASFLTVVAATGANVEVTSSAATEAGAGGVPAMLPGQTRSFALGQFDVLQIGSIPGADLTGSVVCSDVPVAVYSGATLADMGSGPGDHAEEAMLPVALWGRTYHTANTAPLFTGADIWRILASEDDTTVTTDPVQAGTPAVINRGQFVQIKAAANFEVSADRPILVGRYTDGCGGGGGGKGYCDNSLNIMLPPERFFRRVVFGLSDFLPLLLDGWVDLVAPAGAQVTVDGTAVPAASFSAIGSSGYRRAQVAVDLSLSKHVVDADQPIGVYATHGCCGTTISFLADYSVPANLAPVCDAGGPYTAACSGPATAVAVSGAGSSDPESQPLRFSWSSGSPAVAFDDVTLAAPRVTVSGLGTFPLDLDVNDGLRSSRCSTTVTVTGDPSTPPELSLPPLPLWLVKRAPGIGFSFEDRGSAPSSYSVYEGALRVIDSHAPLTCNAAGASSTPGRSELEAAPAAGSRYYLVTASNCAGESPSGLDPALSSCAP